MDSIRKIQLIELEILKEVVRVCEKHSIDYWLAAGTMLGAVRHHGFIPWDDDIDIFMRFDDIERFENIASKELPTQYKIDSQRTNSDNGRLYIKVVKTGTAVKYNAGGAVMESDLWIDIFPLLNMADDKKSEHLIVEKLRKIQDKCQLHPTIAEKDKWIVIFIKRIISFFLGIYEKNCWREIAKLGKKGNRYIILSPLFYRGIPYSRISIEIFPKSLFTDCSIYQFEDMKCRGVKEYDYYLTQRYGDWRTPVNDGGHIVEE